MRWAKSDDYVGISLGLCTDGRQVWDVDTNMAMAMLPIEFRAQPEKTDAVGLERLRSAVASWALRNGFSLPNSGDSLQS